MPCPQHNLAESICERHGTLAATGTMSLMFFCKMPKKSSLLYSINVVSLRAFTAEVPWRGIYAAYHIASIYDFWVLRLLTLELYHCGVVRCCSTVQGWVMKMWRPLRLRVFGWTRLEVKGSDGCGYYEQIIRGWVAAIKSEGVPFFSMLAKDLKTLQLSMLTPHNSHPEWRG